ncbi:TIGR01458 family HAD-type hydrolase [Methanospirillum stamsii]
MLYNVHDTHINRYLIEIGYHSISDHTTNNLIMQIQAVLLDIDGALFTGNEPIAGAEEAIRSLQKRSVPYRYISNGTRKSRINVRKKLERLGVRILENEICTPAMAAIQYLREREIKVCNLLITRDLLHDFADAGITHDPLAPTVVVGDAGEQFTYESMNSAFRSLLGNGEFIALEKDRYWKDTDGLSLSAGPFVSALEYGSGREAIIMGKPSHNFFRYGCSELGTHPSHVAMIGDDIRTDVKGAQDTGLIGIITFTGKFSQDELKTCGVTPDLSIHSIAELPHLIEKFHSPENHPA